ncbi:MAG: acetyl-CoA carboxylase biotin carboxylase subunit family protein [Gemmatimonas sp.]|jgi:biotin carboxylase|uniref:ATP-grasp domain-containing protein n=1 Tax=Gemmatimonas sp. TaxID=1962908 RepID=UPI0022C74F05|nr:ATP-grasp domain-containing protein [Gemmatimonas sp.]MCA2983933.1 ATP-grasp domain-containing protein [Gemmatimonas sp.]MCA2996083.1 ATP-grasp domain-containing protein [Gemmatimonas sp.]MCE2953517.1 ATP-grasp domain-containing protein [Gemmatimonas sp.]MCZ8010603.1 ATP-grasp domain-containing protein [Gemmatimonas sp.]MCZ8267167.1 ATP-grasp domain-containing protein [Gemmatimonas sp.]
MLVIFVCPFFSPAATQMIEAALNLTHVRLAVVAQQPLAELAPAVGSRLVAHWQVADVTNADQLAGAVSAIAAAHGAVARCFAAYEQCQLPLAQVRERLGIPGLPAAAAHNFRDKARMKDVLRAAGVPVARHQLVHEAADARRFVHEVGFPIVVKPPAGAGAKATERVRTVAELEQVLQRYAPSAHDPMLAEEFLRGTEHSLETVSINGHAVWHSLTRYAPTPLEVLETPWIQWTVLLPREVDDPAYADIRAVGDRALRALGMTTGVSHCEWFRRPDGSVAVSEIAARPPGANMTTMISRANDMDFVGAWVRLMVDGTFTPPERRYAVGTAYLRGQGQGTVAAVEGLDQVQREWGHLICDYRLPHLGQSPTGSYEGEGFMIVRHPDTGVVQAALARIISTIRVVLR